MMKTIQRTLLLCVFFSLPFVSLAWGVLGHRIVGEIADKHLTAKARAEIRKILGNESIAMSANWGDFIKSDSTYDYLNPWHYINLDSGMTRNEILAYLKTDTVVDVYTRVNFLAAELKKKNLTLEKKRMYLRLLVHFIGDIHQPMHIGRRKDLGGNRV
ncbi:MAG: S1/P1 Nuclease, partial [Chitinophagaceae bacterium]